MFESAYVPRPLPLFPSPRANVLGVGIHTLSMADTVQAIAAAVEQGFHGYVCITGVHGIMEAQRDPAFLHILNHSYLTAPDGMPAVWVGRWEKFGGMERVYGPDLMLEVCRRFLPSRGKHFFYGGKPGVADRLRAVLEQRFPGIRIVGTYTPPFRHLNPSEEEDLEHAVAAASPDFLWVGLSTPKQEYFMADHLSRLDAKVMLGVGAAFDIHAGLVRDAPAWVKRSGLQWVHRLIQEPRRLAARYLLNNPKFMARIAGQVLGLRKYPSPPQFSLGLRLHDAACAAERPDLS